MRRSGISRIGGLVKTTLQDMGLQEKILQQQALGKWAEVVGRQVSASTVPESIRDGVLFVCCKSSMWSSELSLHREDILKRLNAAVGRQVVKDIRFAARGFRKAGADTDGSDDMRPAARQSTADEIRTADELASICAHEELAERVKRAVLTSKKRLDSESG